MHHANNNLLYLYEEEEDEAAEDKLWPDAKRNGLGVEQCLERRCISKKQLQHYDGADAQRQVLVAKVRLQRQSRTTL